MNKSKMQIITSDCWKCHGKMKIALMLSDNSFSGPSEFTKEQIIFAQNKGVILKEHFSKTVNEKYTANTCGHCGAFIGNHFIHDYLYDPDAEEFEM